jgi:2,3-bisphosphoglycerate-independent phosphoglycerate mutase
MSKKAILIIMDGWGIGAKKAADAIQNANVPFVTGLYSTYPNSTLTTFGEQVGLPEGQMGNSEVGHLNLGAGRIVYQELERINVDIKNGGFFKRQEILSAINYAKANNKKLHLLGLISDGGVHSHINHVKALATLCQQQNFTNVFIHAFTDGRDTDPKSGLGYLEDLQQHLHKTTGQIASICGRYYAMDRDKRWERVKLAYDALVNGVGDKANDLLAAVKNNYDAGITDEFLKPIINENAQAKIEAGDAVICFNFRTDRCREITEVLTQQNMPEHSMQTINLHYTTFTTYDSTYKNVHVVYTKDNLENTLGEVISKAGKTQLRIAETEKYPHVSFFFSGGREETFVGEERIVVASPKVATYDLQPEMSAYEVAEKTVDAIQTWAPDFICLNFANADMVGHTGIWEACIKAVEAVDACVEKVVTSALEKDYAVFLLADHGNADYEINEDGSPNTAHTTNPVPFFVIDKNFDGQVKAGKLGDIAPTILTMMNIAIPAEMTGNVLI